MSEKYPPFDANFENQEMVKNDINKTSGNKFNNVHFGFKLQARSKVPVSESVSKNTSCPATLARQLHKNFLASKP